MDIYSFVLGVILGVGLPYAVVEVRDFFYRRSVQKNAPSAKPWADAPPSIACPLPSPHSHHDERVCAISWYLKHQDPMRKDTFPTLTAKQAVSPCGCHISWTEHYAQA